ncbi:MAG: hypothetical protein ABIF09_07300 [Gemmatimonadota bacterium]
MRHVTDGELHAFLDGALDLLPENRGEEVRDHLSVCPVCSERLQDEEALRTQAENILGDPDFGGVALPTFEELRERAEAPGSIPTRLAGEPEAMIHYRGPIRGLPLAWAATIILALGVGWMGGQVSRSLPDSVRPGGPGSVLPPRQQPADLSADLDAEAILTGEPQSSPITPRAVSAPLEAEEGPPPGPQPERSGTGEGGRITDRTVMGSAALVFDSIEPLMASKVGMPDAGARVRADGAEGTEANPGLLENALALRGLKVVSISWEERVPGEKALLIRQLLSPGDTLELRYLGMLLGTDPDLQGLRERGIPLEEAHGGRVYANVLEASLPPGWHQVVMERGRGLLVARGPLSEANLKALLKTLQ